MSRLINNLIKDGYLKTDRIIDAFAEISRVEFVPKEFELQAEANVSLPVGYGQTISQPLTVAFMLELLDAGVGQKILDVGSGTGWTAALLARIVGENGRVVAVERIKGLFERSRENIEKFGFISSGRVECFNQDGCKGFPQEAPYDRILVSAEAKEIPEDLKEQLGVGGKMVVPVENSIIYLEKKEDGIYEEKFPGFSFVPLIIENQI